MLTYLKTWLPRLGVALAASVLLLAQFDAAQLWFQHGWAALTFPYPLDYGEGPVLDQAIRLAHFQNIYRTDLSQPPYTISNYPPLFPLTQVPFVWLFGAAFWYGRGITLLSTLVAALFIGLTVHTLTRDRLAGLVGGLMLLAFPYILHWSPFNRVDALALGLCCAGLFVIARWPERRAGLIASALLLAAAIYTRQSYGLAAPFAAFVWLLHEPPRRRAFEYAGIVAGAGLIIFMVLQLLTGGGFFFNIVTANVNPFNWREVGSRAKEIYEHLPYLLAGCALFVAVAVWLKVRSWWLIAPFLAGAVASAITIGKSGSNVNYLFELAAAMSLVSGALVAWLGTRFWLQIPLLLLLSLQVSGMAQWSRDDYYGRVMSKIEQRQAIEQLAQIANQSPGPVLADEYMGLVPLAGQSLYFQPFELKQLAEAGIWDDQALADAIERGEFPVILLYQPPDWDSRGERWTRRTLLAISFAYEPGEKYADTVVYRPLR